MPLTISFIPRPCVICRSFFALTLRLVARGVARGVTARPLPRPRTFGAASRALRRAVRSLIPIAGRDVLRRVFAAVARAIGAIGFGRAYLFREVYGAVCRPVRGGPRTGRCDLCCSTRTVPSPRVM